MSDLERNRQIVQEGLDRRANKRKQRIADAEHEIITINMFQIINTNAHDAEERRKAEQNAARAYNEMVAQKANKKLSQKIAMLKQRRNVSVTNTIASLLMLIASAVFFVVGLTELSYMIVTSVMSAFVFTFNLCIFVTTQKKLNWRA